MHRFSLQNLTGPLRLSAATLAVVLYATASVHAQTAASGVATTLAAPTAAAGAAPAPALAPAPDAASGAAPGRTPVQGRPILRDGDLTFPREPQAPQDGVLPIPALDGSVSEASPSQVDQRSAADIAAFETPPAGYDARLFQIEDISPGIDRRTRQLFIEQALPFDPVGVRVGSFVLFPEIEIASRFLTNALSSADDSPDRVFEVRPTARLVSNWANHALELRGSVNGTSYNEFKSEDERGYLIEARGRLDVRRRTNIQGVIGRQRSQEARTAVDAALAGPRTSVVTDTGEVALNHRFNRLRVRLRGGVRSETYGASLDPITGIDGNADRDNQERAIGMRASWEFKPTLSVFAEAEGNARDFERVGLADGLSRNSAGLRLRSGLSFGQTGAYLRGEVALGYGRQDFEDGRLEDVDGLIFDANLAWRVNGLTRVLFESQTNFVNSTTAGTGGVFERRLRLGLRHAFRPYLTGLAGVEVTDRSFAGIGLDEREVAYNLGVEYNLRREAVLFGTYERTVFRTDFPVGSFDNDEVRVGIRLRR